MEEISTTQVETLLEDGTITGGMIPKLFTAVNSIKNGLRSSTILDGRVPHALLLELYSDCGVGSRIVHGDEGLKVSFI